MGFQSHQPITAEQIQQRWPELVHEIQGAHDFSVHSVSGALEAEPGDLVFAHQDKILKALSHKSVGLIVLSSQRKSELQAIQHRAAVLSSEPEVLMVHILKEFFQTTPDVRGESEGIHPTALVHSSSEIHPTASVGPFAVIGEGVKIGAGAVVAAHTVLRPQAEIGANVVLHPFVFVGPGCVLKSGAEVHSSTVLGKEGFGYAATSRGEQLKIPHLGKVVLEENVHVGACCTIDRGTLGDTVIGTGTKIDNRCHIGHNCKIGAHGMITAHFVMAGSSQIGNYFVCGGQTVIGGHLKITDRVQLAALSVVSKDIEKPGAYGGYPLQPLKEFLKTKALSGHMVEFKRDITEIKKKLNL